MRLGNQIFDWGKKTYLMGVLNVTPDSFSDGGAFDSLEAALAQANSLIAAGADILDIGGESTRPGAESVSCEAEINRVVPVIKALTKAGIDIPISVDTTKAAVAQAALESGATMVNDVSAGTFDGQMLEVVAHFGVPVVLMHLRGTPKTMQSLTTYEDLIGEICEFFLERIVAAQQAGISPSQIILDPGLGFAKTYQQNLEIIRRLRDFVALGYPILVAPSRKSFIGHILNQPDPQKRVWGTAAVCTACIAGGANILRVHDVAEIRDGQRVADAIFKSD